MSFTVTCSRSRIDSSICRWRVGIIGPASATTERSSSGDIAWPLSVTGFTPNSRRNPYAALFVSQVTGVITNTSTL